MDCENDVKTSGKTIYLVPLLSVPYTRRGETFPKSTTGCVLAANIWFMIQ